MKEHKVHYFQGLVQTGKAQGFITCARINSAPKSCELDPIPSKLLIECLDSIIPSLTDLFDSSQASFYNASSQLLSHLFSNRSVLITMIRTTIGLSLIYALLLRYWKNLSYPKFLPTSTLTIFHNTCQ